MKRKQRSLTRTKKAKSKSTKKNRIVQDGNETKRTKPETSRHLLSHYINLQSIKARIETNITNYTGGGELTGTCDELSEGTLLHEH